MSTMSLFRRDLADRLGGFDESLPPGRGLGLLDPGDPRRVPGSAPSPTPWRSYNRIGPSLSTDVAGMAAATRTVLEKVAARDDLRPEEASYVERRLAGESPAGHTRAAQEDLAAGRWAAAAEGYREAARLSPRNRPLRLRAAALKAAPRVVGPVLRRRS